MAFLGFLIACRFAQPKKLFSESGADSVEFTVSESETDTDVLVKKSGCDAPGAVEDTREQKQLKEQSVFRILCLASATVFGSLASVVFFVNLFFINIGTNVVEGLVRQIFTTFDLFVSRECRANPGIHVFQK